MPARAPLDLLAEELGDFAGRVERDLALRFAVKEAALAARESALEAREAEREMRLVRMEQATAEKLATLQNGRDGVDGRSWTARGAYDPLATYGNGDVVWREMSPFLALCDDPGPCAEGNANWQLVVPRSSRGQRGKDGERGPRPVGLTALPDYMAQLVLDDGTMGEPFSVRAWFEPHDPHPVAEAAP